MSKPIRSPKEARELLLKTTEKLTLVPDVLSRAGMGDSSLTPSQLGGAERVVREALNDLNRVAEALEAGAT